MEKPYNVSTVYIKNSNLQVFILYEIIANNDIFWGLKALCGTKIPFKILDYRIIIHKEFQTLNLANVRGQTRT